LQRRRSSILNRKTQVFRRIMYAGVGLRTKQDQRLPRQNKMPQKRKRVDGDKHYCSRRQCGRRRQLDVGLESLPDELLVGLFEQISDSESFLGMALLCRHLAAVAQDDQVCDEAALRFTAVKKRKLHRNCHINGIEEWAVYECLPSGQIHGLQEEWRASKNYFGNMLIGRSYWRYGRNHGVRGVASGSLRKEHGLYFGIGPHYPDDNSRSTRTHWEHYQDGKMVGPTVEWSLDGSLNSYDQYYHNVSCSDAHEHTYWNWKRYAHDNEFPVIWSTGFDVALRTFWITNTEFHRETWHNIRESGTIRQREIYFSSPAVAHHTQWNSDGTLAEIREYRDSVDPATQKHSFFCVSTRYSKDGRFDGRNKQHLGKSYSIPMNFFLEPDQKITSFYPT